MSILVNATTAGDTEAILAAVTAKYFLDFDVMWLVQAGVLVFLMHLGFMTLEAGSVQMKNKDNIIFKNFLTVAISALSYWALGFGLAYGTGGLTGDAARFIGSGSFFIDSVSLDGADEDGVVQTYGQGFYFFQWAFAATAATIVSGAVAGRMRLEAYMITALWITGFVYPVVTHWVWSSEGWLSAFSSLTPLFADSYPAAAGMFDFAGSAVVHMTGGVAAFWGAFFLGPRIDYKEAKGHNLPLVFIGTMLLWFGWYGFNCGSTLVFDNFLAGKVAVTTTLAPSAAVVFGMIYLKLKTGTWDLVNSLNCALAGLVSITANCIIVDDFAAIPIGIIGALLYIYGSAALKNNGIDDPVGAIAVHGICGAWGAIAVGIFGNPNAADAAYGTSFAALGYVSTQSNTGVEFQFTPLPPYQMAVQVTGVAAIIAWVTAMTVPLFFIMKVTGFIRVSEQEEIDGLDASEHKTTQAVSETILEEKP